VWLGESCDFPAHRSGVVDVFHRQRRALGDLLGLRGARGAVHIEPRKDRPLFLPYGSGETFNPHLSDICLEFRHSPYLIHGSCALCKGRRHKSLGDNPIRAAQHSP